MLQDEVGYKITTSEKKMPPTAFEGEGQFHYELVEDTFKIVDIKFSSSVLISAIVLTMPMDKIIYKMSTSVVGQGIQYPDEITNIGVR